MSKIGFSISKKKGFGQKREMLFGDLKRNGTILNKPWFKYPKNKTINSEVVIIGAGLAGISLAYFLNKNNIRTLILEEEENFASKASSNPYAVFAPNFTISDEFLNYWSLDSFNTFVEFLDSVDNRIYSKCGILELYDENRIQKLKKTDFSKYIEIYEKEIFIKNAGWIDSTKLCNHYLLESNSKIFYSKKIGEIRKEDKLWKLFSINGELILETEILFFANSYNINQNFPQFQNSVQSVRGQILLIPKEYLEHSKTEIIIHQEGYFIPNINKFHLIGSTFNPNDKEIFSKESDSQLLLNRLRNVFPNLGKVDLSKCISWVGFRAVSPDHFPLVGMIPDFIQMQKDYKDIWKALSNKIYPEGSYLDGLYISTAHGSKGVLNSFYSAKILVDLILGRELNKELLEKINPSRFFIKSIQRREI